MTESEIYDALLPVFRDVFDDETLSIEPTSNASTVAGWDSFNHIQLIVAVEGKFRVKFTSGEVESLANVGEFVRLIQKKLGR
jgi:acyl carrier protein